MGFVRNQSLDNGGERQGSANVANTGSGFSNLRDIIGRLDDSSGRDGGSTYAWQDRARPQGQSQRDELDSLNGMPKPGEKSEDERAKGRQNWDGESTREMSDVDRIVAGLGRVGDISQADVGGDFSNNLFSATVGSLLSPVTAIGSAIQNAYEAATGRPVSEANEDMEMPDYDLDSNQKAASAANAAIDFAGLAFGGSKDMISAGVRGVRYSAAKKAGESGKKLASDIASEAAETFGKSGMSTFKKYMGNMAEEAGEEGVQQFLSDVRYDQYDEGTIGRMAEAAGWGAVGGATMTGAAHLMSKATSRGADTTTDNKPDSDATSGRPSYSDFTTPAKTIGQADADIQDSIDKLQTENRYVHGSTSYKVAQGYPYIRPDEIVLGTEGIRKMYYESDDSANYIADKIGMKREDLDQVFATASARDIADTLNAAISTNPVEVYGKRDPHTKRDSYMKFRVREIVPGNTVMVNTMVPQMFGGDVDGDMLSVMWNTDITSSSMYPTEAMMHGRRQPVSSSNFSDELPGRYQENFLDKDYIGFTLDEGVFDSEWNVNGVDAVADALSPIAGLSDEKGNNLAEKYHRILRDSWSGDFYDRLSYDEQMLYGDGAGRISGDKLKSEMGFDETVMQLNNMTSDIRDALIRGGMSPHDAYVAANTRYTSEIIWKLQQNTGMYIMMKKMSMSGADDVVKLVVDDIPALDSAQAPRKSGTSGAHTRAVTVFTQMNVIDQAFDMAANTGLRFKQNMFWTATSSRIVDDAIRQLPEPDQIQTFILAMMRINNEESTPMRMMENLFRGYVSSRFRKAIGIDSMSFADSKIYDDIEKLKRTFAEAYNDVLSRYTKALEATGIDGEFTRYFSKGRSPIDADNDRSFASAYLDIFGTFEADDEGHTLLQMIDNTINGDPGSNTIDMVLDRGGEANRFYRSLVAAYNKKRESMGKRFESYIKDIEAPSGITWDENGRASYDQLDAPWIQYYWELMKNAIGIEEAHAYGLVNFKSAVNSRWGRALFGNDFDAKMNAVLSLRMMYKYRDYGRYKMREIKAIEDARSASDDAERKNLEERAKLMGEKAIAAAKSNLGISELDNDIVNEIVSKGTDNYLMNLVGTDLTYESKSEWFAKRRRRYGIGSDTCLIEQAVRKDGSSIGGSEFSNALTQMERAKAKCGQMSIDNANRIVDSIFDLTKIYKADDVCKAITQTMAQSSQKINIDLISAVYFDAADVLKKHVDKGTSTPTEAQLYQMVSTIYDTGAKSAINKITGTSLGSGTTIEYAKSKREILRALSDPDYKGIMVNQDASGYTYVTRDAMFEAIAGVKLDGRDPSLGEWRALLKAAPQIATWIGDTTFLPVPDGDSVTEAMVGSPVEQIKSNISGSSESDVYNREISAIESRIVNDPNNARLVLGVIGSKFKGDAFDDLIENPSRFRDEVRSAFRSLASYAHRTLSDPASQKIVNIQSQVEGRDKIIDQVFGIVNEISGVSDSMKLNGSKMDRSFAKSIEKRFMTSELIKRVYDSDAVRNMIGNAGDANLDPSMDATLSAVDASIKSQLHDASRDAIEQKLIMTILQISGSRYMDPYGGISLADADTVKVIRVLCDLGISQDDAQDIVNAAASENFVDIELNPDVITPGDLSIENAETLADKMYSIISSGKYRIDEDVTRDKILGKIMDLHAKGKEGELEKQVNRYNGLIISGLIDDFAGVNGIRYNRGFYSAGLDAYTQLSKMMNGLIDEVDSGRLNVSASPSSMSQDTVDFDFTNRSLGVMADFAVSSLEGSGNSLMSGIEGGEYQQLVSIASLNGSYSFSTPARAMRVRDVKNMLRNGDKRFYGASFHRETFAVDDPSSIQSMRPREGDRMRRNLTLDSIDDISSPRYIQDKIYDKNGGEKDAWMFVYPLDDSPIPDNEHMVPTDRRGPFKNANALTTFLIDLVYDRSEPGTFKRKKSIGLFDRIASDFNSDYGLGNSAIPRPDLSNGVEGYRAKLIENFRDVRSQLADHYLQLFRSEKMDKFGGHEAMMLSMLTTQVIEMRNADGSRWTLSASDLWSPARFASLADPANGGNDLSSIESIRVVCQPISSVCTRISNSIADRFADAYETDSYGDITEQDMTDAAVEAFESYRDFGFVGSDGIREMVSMISPLSRAGHRDIEIGRSALPPSRLINMMEGTRMGQLDLGGSSDSTYAHMDEQWMRDAASTIDMFHVSVDGETSSQFNDRKIAIAFSRIEQDPNGRNIFSNSRADNVSMLGVFKSRNLTGNQISNVPSITVKSDKISKATGERIRDVARPAVLSALSSSNTRGYKSIFDELMSLRRDSGNAPLLLVPYDDRNKIGLPDFAYTGATADMVNDMGNTVQFAIYDPMLVPLSDQYVGATPDLFPIKPSEIETYIANPLLSDSATLFNPSSTNKKSHIESVYGIQHDILFNQPSLRNSVIQMPGTGSNPKADLDAFRMAFENRADGKSGFVYPKLPEGNTSMDEAEMEAAVKRYLSVADSYVDDPLSPCFIKHDVSLGDCIGFVKTPIPNSGYLGFEYAYSPVIINKGGLPVNIGTILCSIDPRNRDMLQVDVSGDYSATEADVIKMTFGGEPYKTEGRLATDSEWNGYGLSMGADINVNGHQYDIDVMYSHETENGRLIDRGTLTTAETLFYANQATGGGLFIKMVDGKPHLDFEAANRVGISDDDLIRLVGVKKWDPIWDKVINGEILISEDRDVNEAIKSVAMAVKNSNMAIGSRVSISPATILSSYSFDSNGNPRLNLNGTSNTDYYFGLILNRDRLLKMFHFINPNLCPDGMDDNSDAPYLVNKRGQIRVKTNGNMATGQKYMYANGHFMLSRLKHDSSQLGIPTRRSAFGNQQLINSILERGFSNARDVSEAIKLISIESGNYTPYLIDGRYYKKSEYEDDPFYTDNVDMAVIADSELDYRYDERVSKAGQTTYMNMLKVVDNRRDRNVLSPADGRLKEVYSKFNQAMKWDRVPDPLMDQAIFKMATGYSYNDGDGSDTVTIDKLREGFTKIIKDINNSDGYFIKGGYVNNRYSLPLGPKPIMRYIWNHSGLIKDKAQKAGITFEQWIESAAKEMDATKEAVGGIRPNRKDKRIALETIMEFCYRSHNMGYRGPSLSGYYSIGDMTESYDPLFRSLEASDKDLIGIRQQQQYEMAQRISQWKIGRDLDKYKTIDVPMSPNGFAASWFGMHKNWWEFTAKNLEMMSRTMSLCTSPMLGASALASRAKGAGLTNATLFLRNRGNYVIKDQRGLKDAMKSSEARAVWSAINEIQFTQDGMQGMLEALDHGDVIEYVEHMHKRSGNAAKISRTITKIQTADGALSDWQMRIYVNEFAQNLPDDSIWLQVEKNGKTMIENRVLSDPAGFLIDTLTLKDNNPDFSAANAARDLAMSGDFCQRTSYGMILTEIFRKHPIGEFIVVTNFLKFPQYAINSGGFFLQQIAPVSALYHWSTSALIRKAKSENPYLFGAKFGVDLRSMDLESTLRYKDFKQACYADAAHLTVSALASLIIQGVIQFEPPEDEEGNLRDDLIGNLNEWTVFGQRIGDIWWLQDIMGPAFALAAFTRTVSMGQPRLDIIGNWFGQALWNNPVMRASDVVGSLFGSDESTIDQLIEEADLYQNAKGGEPSLSDMAASGAFTYGMNWMSQFFMPSILKEFYRWGPEYETSYKRTYVTDSNGNVVLDDNGMPYTTVTSYQDQMLRKAARNNPFMALVMNFTSQSETGYSNFSWMNSLAGKYDPPLTTYYQIDELACVQYYSLYTTDEYGNEVPKSAEEMNNVAWDVLTVLENCDDPYELRASGWVIPYDTKEYVSKVLWDTKYYTQQLYSQWKEEVAYDYTVLGNGDFGAGQKIAEQAKQQYYDDLNHIDALYDLLWDDAFSSGITQYNRYNTTYQQDSYGNWYATGFRRGNPIFSIQTAPGSLSDPGSTLGMEGNWETPAARNPEISAGGRALVPIDTTYTDRPSISSWSEDGSGGGYSDMVALTYGALAGNELGDSGDGSRSTFSTWYSQPYWNRSGYGGYYRSSGGGGGYTPNLYSRLPSVNMPYASTMYAERSYDPSYDYLRPNFETKGSREAYKRSDI